MSSTIASPATLEDVLARYWGYTQFRPHQREVMDAILAGRDSLLVMPTGGGKSLCFQAPALLKPGVAVVVSPLIASSARVLMTNSAKYAHYGPGILNVDVAFGTTVDCVESAVRGRVMVEDGPWAR